MKALTDLIANGICAIVLFACIVAVIQGVVMTYYIFVSDHLCFCKGDECVRTVRYKYAIQYDPDAEHWTGRSKDYRNHWRSHKNIPPKPSHQN